MRPEIVRAGARIAGRLVHRREKETFTAMQNGFGAVAVVRVGVPDGDTLRPEIFLCVQRGDGDLVEITKPHRLPCRRVMAGRAHERKRRRARRERVQRGLERRGDRATRVFGDAGKIRRVLIEVARDGEAIQVRGRVRKKERFVGDGRARNLPRPIRMCRAQVRRGFRRARGLLGAHRGAVVGAPGIVKDEHRGFCL